MDIHRFFLDAEGRARPIWRLVLYVALAIPMGISLSSLMGVVLRVTGIPKNFEVRLLLAGLIAAVVYLVAAVICLRLLDRRPFGALGLWFYHIWWREFALGILLGTVMVSVVVGVEFGAGAVRFGWGGGAQAGKGLAWALAMLLPAALGEELLLRGYPFQRLIDSIGAWPATALLSIIFGLLHLSNPSRTLLSTLNTILIGVFLAVAYLKTRGLWLPFGVHFSWNFFLGFIYSLPVSGLNLHNRLLEAKVSATIFLTGGSYGPEGSLVTTLVIIVATAWLWRSRKISVSEEMAHALKSSSN